MSILEGYEYLKEEPHLFQSLGGSRLLLAIALSRTGTINEFRGQIWSDAYKLGASEQQEKSFYKGFKKGEIHGEVEGIKKFMIEGGEYVSITANGPKRTLAMKRAQNSFNEYMEIEELKHDALKKRSS